MHGHPLRATRGATGRAGDSMLACARGGDDGPQPDAYGYASTVRIAGVAKKYLKTYPVVVKCRKGRSVTANDNNGCNGSGERMKKAGLLVAALGIVGTAQAGVVDDLTSYYAKEAGLAHITIVIPPGHALLVGGRPTLVSGPGQCPTQPVPGSDGIWVMGMSNDAYAQSYAGQRGCAVVGPTTTTLSVTLHDKARALPVHNENWTVEHQQIHGAQAMLLKRASGELIVDAQ